MWSYLWDVRTYCVNCVHEYLSEEICCIKIAYFWNSLSKKKKKNQKWIHLPGYMATGMSVTIGNLISHK